MMSEGLIHKELSGKIIGAAITGLDLALLLNFRFAKLQWKRVVRTTRPEPAFGLEPGTP
jgi:hypothetical protein